MPEEVGEAGGSVCPSESLCGSIETASDDFALRRRLVILSAIKVLLDIRHVDGAIGKEGVGKDADGLACEFAEEALDACPARALRLGVALVVTVPLRTGSAPRIVRNWLDGFWLRSYAESEKHKPETIHETH